MDGEILVACHWASLPDQRDWLQTFKESYLDNSRLVLVPRGRKEIGRAGWGNVAVEGRV